MKRFRTTLPAAFILILLALSAHAQGKLEFRKVAHSFGDVKEAGGPKRAYFSFKNTGTLPVKISYVQASCGCTTPEWSKAAVAPGDTGFVIAEYNPLGRPGIFNKTLTVFSDAEPATYSLKISGKVLEKPKLPEDIYTDTIGPELRMVTRFLSLGKISPTGAKKEDYFKLYNGTQDPVTVSIASKIPKWLMVKMEPATIPAGKEAVMAISLDPAKRKDYGFVRDELTLKVAGKQTYTRTITVSAMLEETAKVLSEPEAEAGARILIRPATEQNLGKVAQNSQTNLRYEVENTGKNVLEIHAVKPDCACLTKVKYPKKLKPGQNGTITMRYNSGTQTGGQFFHIPVYSNDMANPTLPLGLRVSITR